MDGLDLVGIEKRLKFYKVRERFTKQRKRERETDKELGKVQWCRHNVDWLKSL